VIHGYRTIFPIPLAQAATFDPHLTELAAATAAREATAEGVNWTFAPMLDIARDPRWGRVAEGIGLLESCCPMCASGLRSDSPMINCKPVNLFVTSCPLYLLPH